MRSSIRINSYLNKNLYKPKISISTTTRINKKVKKLIINVSIQVYQYRKYSS